MTPCEEHDKDPRPEPDPELVGWVCRRCGVEGQDYKTD
jgi:hypothetical protein